MLSYSLGLYSIYRTLSAFSLSRDLLRAPDGAVLYTSSASHLAAVHAGSLTRLQQCNGGERAKVPSLGWPFCFLLLDWFRRVNGVYAQPISSAFPARLQARNCSARHGCGPRRRVSGGTGGTGADRVKGLGDDPVPAAAAAADLERGSGRLRRGGTPSVGRSVCAAHPVLLY